MKTALLFDLDGTLIDSKPVAVEVFRAAYRQCGGSGQPPVGSFLAMAGRPFEEIARELALPSGMGRAFREGSQSQAHRIGMVPGMRNVLDDVRSLGAAVGVITGKDRQRTEHLLAQLDLSSLCQEVVTPSDPPRPKPSPDGVHWLCQKLGATALSTALIGDSVSDIMAGNAAGVHTVACLWGVGSAADLLAAGANQIVATPMELTAVLQRFTTARAEPPARGGASSRTEHEAS